MIDLYIYGGTPGYTYHWNKEEMGNSQQVANLADGDYKVSVTDVNGCQITKEIEVGVANDYCIFIPTAFSPNGDGANDTWELRGINKFYPNSNVYIFNRWGQLIYSQKNGYHKPWDGKYKGRDLPVDSYHFIIEFDDSAENITGNVSIVK